MMADITIRKNLYAIIAYPIDQIAGFYGKIALDEKANVEIARFQVKIALFRKKHGQTA